MLFIFLCGFLILSLASTRISGASGSKLTSETPMEELSPTLARYVRIEGLHCARLPDHVRTDPSTKPQHFGAEAKIEYYCHVN